MSEIKKPRKGNKGYCCVIGCNVTANCPPGTRFYCFPSAAMEHRKIRRQKWIDAVKRQNPDGSQWQPSKYSRICSQHFVGNAKSEDPASPGYNPTIFPEVYHKSVTSTESVLKRCDRSVERKNFLKNEPLIDPKIEDTRLQDKIEIHQQNKVEFMLESSLEQLPTSTCPPIDHRPNLSTTRSQGTQADFIQKHDEPRFHIFLCNLYNNPTKYEAEVQTHIPTAFENPPLKITNRVSKNCGTAAKSEDKACEPNMNNCSLPSKCSNNFHEIPSIASDQQMLDIAGVTISTFHLLLKVLTDQLSSSNIANETKDRCLLIFLMKMKTGLTFSALSALFALDGPTISRIFYSTLTYLTKACKSFVLWPPREAAQTTVPASFKDSYQACRVVINCTEMRIDVPKSVKHRIEFYSDYKKGYTIKALVGCTANGRISFISRCYGGRTTNSQMATRSGIFKLLEPGDVVLADKVFPEISAALDNDERVIIATQLSSARSPLNKADSQDTCDAVNVRSNIDKCMQRLRMYKILNNLSANMLPSCDKIIFMCGVLVNCQSWTCGRTIN